MIFDLDINKILNEVNSNRKLRAIYAQFRSKYLNPKLVKQAFDTRRINQNTEFNPRRNLQYYQRSEPYIDNKIAEQIKLFFKVKTAADDLRQEFIGEPDWLDSYTRILCNAIDQTLRVEQKDFDYSKSQLEYLSELLYVRYRLRPEDIEKLSQHELRNIILNKDERLLRRSIFTNYKDGLNKNSTPQSVQMQDTLMDKLFGNVKANKENKEVERSVVITIKDKVIDQEIVKSAGRTRKQY